VKRGARTAARVFFAFGGLSLVAGLSPPLAALAAPAPAWVIDKAASQIRFTSSMAGESFTGAFRRWDADIRFDPANLAGSGVTASVDVASAATGNPDRDQALPTAAFFNAPAFPRATFVAHGFSAAGPGRYVAHGVLTLRGVGKPVDLPFTLVVAGPQARMSGTVVINRLAFGVGQGEWSATTTIPAAVTVSIGLAARRVP
jgi:polyisoprenoid-binding protein YceI